MSPEAIKLTKRAVIDYMAGNFGEFERLRNLALEHLKEMGCRNCHGTQVPCGYYIQGVRHSGYVCLQCGQVTSKDGIRLRSGKKIC